MKAKNKIAIIIPYFGTFPEWFNLYLESCSYNNFIDFIFYTDCDKTTADIPNVIYNKISFKDYCQKVSNALNINFHPDKPYKLCDVRPFYGIIHKDILNSYAFWGFGDIDVVYGDLSIILNNHNLAKYDIITTHTDRVAGHFTVIRTNSKLTYLCYKIKNWRYKLEQQKNFSIDEEEWGGLIYPEMKFLHKIYGHICKPLHIPRKYCYGGILNRLFCNFITRRYFREFGTSPVPENGQKWTYLVNKGLMINPQQKSIPYLHFIFFKKNIYRESELYWRNGFYQVFSLKKTDIITFDNTKISNK